MTRYASSDIHSFINSACPTGGHIRKITNQREVNKGAKPEYEGERLVITCAVCEPLLNAKDSWSGDPLNIPMTQAEQAEADKQVKDGMKHAALQAQALAELANERLAAKS